jgi:hypothetical protein
VITSGFVRHLGRPAVGDDTALVQHGDAVGQRQHAVDVVLDQQHGVGLAKLADQRADHLAIGLGQAGQRLVQQQQFRVGGERDGDLQQPLFAVREVGAGSAARSASPTAASSDQVRALTAVSV